MATITNETKCIGQWVTDIKLEAASLLDGIELDEGEPDDDEHFETDKETATTALEALLALTDPPTKMASLMVTYEMTRWVRALDTAKDVGDEFKAVSGQLDKSGFGKTKWAKELDSVHEILFDI